MERKWVGNEMVLGGAHALWPLLAAQAGRQTHKDQLRLNVVIEGCEPFLLVAFRETTLRAFAEQIETELGSASARRVAAVYRNGFRIPSDYLIGEVFADDEVVNVRLAESSDVAQPFKPQKKVKLESVSPVATVSKGNAHKTDTLSKEGTLPAQKETPLRNEGVTPSGSGVSGTAQPHVKVAANSPLEPSKIAAGALPQSNEEQPSKTIASEPSQVAANQSSKETQPLQKKKPGRKPATKPTSVAKNEASTPQPHPKVPELPAVPVQGTIETKKASTKLSKPQEAPKPPRTPPAKKYASAVSGKVKEEKTRAPKSAPAQPLIAPADEDIEDENFFNELVENDLKEKPKAAVRAPETKVSKKLATSIGNNEDEEEAPASQHSEDSSAEERSADDWN